MISSNKLFICMISALILIGCNNSRNIRVGTYFWGIAPPDVKKTAKSQLEGIKQLDSQLDNAKASVTALREAELLEANRIMTEIEFLRAEAESIRGLRDNMLKPSPDKGTLKDQFETLTKDIIEPLPKEKLDININSEFTAHVCFKVKVWYYSIVELSLGG